MGIDLNSVEEDGEAAAAAAVGVCGELWHACAGPGVALPRRGSAVVYLPQAHLAAGGGEAPAPAPAGAPRVPPHVACRVVGVELCADAATDEVYARLALLADAEMFRQNVRESASEEGEDEMAGGDGEKKPRMPHMFCKTLTASDTSTHGGFSVPRRAAEDCFAPLDYKQVRPSQELVAKDLHGTQWRFRHIYRGQPRRHLLTTGWSSFVNKKKLVSGDAVLFLRGDDGELRLGVRRAVQLRNEALFRAVNSNESKLHTLSAVASSLENRSIFHVCFDPRSGASEFIVPYWRFSKSLNHPFSIGMRFKDSNDSDDANERSTGLISGISEVDPIRWPGSKWRCLQVRWDDGNHCNHQRRVSPWEIERIGGSIQVNDCLSASSSKRAKLYFPQGNLDAPVTDGNDFPDPVETGSFHRVLQGQELLMGSRAQGAARSRSPDVAKFRPPDHQRFSANAGSYMPQQSPAEFPYHSSGFGESLGFPEVLQGQEMSRALRFYSQGSAFDARAQHGPFGYAQRSAAPGGLSPAAQGYALGQFTPSSAAAKVSSPSSVLMFNQATVPQFDLEGRTSGYRGAYGGQCPPGIEMVRETEEAWPCAQRRTPSVTGTGCRRFEEWIMASTPASADGGRPRSAAAGDVVGRSSCRLFGFSLTDQKVLGGAGEGAAKEGDAADEAVECADPRVLDLFGRGHPAPAALHAIVAAPLGM
ncbi:auxin response factor 14 [Aegilops tauschii subsp. strangulata]|uniref:Auxin response factor n=3 Tax=Aegilops tauschii subsp. strangulata TaxID=200361 RepID=A0A452ZJR0_AEGTS|nr:auxin response factor 14 [Aegilops tauschii subsp. strangulata]